MPLFLWIFACFLALVPQNITSALPIGDYSNGVNPNNVFELHNYFTEDKSDLSRSAIVPYNPEDNNNNNGGGGGNEEIRGEISGQVWDDLNCNGVLDPGEPDISGVVVRIYKDLTNNGFTPDDLLVATRITASPYEVTNLELPATYIPVVDPTTLPENYEFSPAGASNNDPNGQYNIQLAPTAPYRYNAHFGCKHIDSNCEYTPPPEPPKPHNQQEFEGGESENVDPIHVCSCKNEYTPQCELAFPEEDEIYEECKSTTNNKTQCLEEWVERTQQQTCFGREDCPCAERPPLLTFVEPEVEEEPEPESRSYSPAPEKTIIELEESLFEGYQPDDLAHTKVIPKTGAIPEELLDYYGAKSILLDVPLNHPFYETMILAKNRGFITAQAGKVEPEKGVMRAEALKWTLMGLSQPVSHNFVYNLFTDTPLGSKYNGIMASSAKRGLIAQPNGQNQSKPEELITVGEISDIIARAFGFSNEKTISDTSSQTKAYAILKNKGIIPYTLSNAPLEKNITRAEALEILIRTLHTKENGDDIYQNEMRISIPKAEIQDLPLSRTLLSEASVWLPDITGGKAGFYEDIRDNRTIPIIFGHSSILIGKDPSKKAVFRPLLQKDFTIGDEFELTRNGIKSKYRVTQRHFVTPNHVSALTSYGNDTHALLFTCDESLEYRYVYWAEQISGEKRKSTLIQTKTTLLNRTAPISVFNNATTSANNKQNMEPINNTANSAYKPLDIKNIPAIVEIKEAIVNLEAPTLPKLENLYPTFPNYTDLGTNLFKNTTSSVINVIKGEEPELSATDKEGLIIGLIVLAIIIMVMIRRSTKGPGPWKNS